MTKSYGVVGIIPCRYGAVRFPGKPLADIHGKPMMWHVYQQAVRSPVLEEVFVATDDQRIFEAAEALDMNVLMTSTEHPTGGDRVAEAADRIEADIYVNVQGDEPMVDPEAITAMTQALFPLCAEAMTAIQGHSSSYRSRRCW